MRKIFLALILLLLSSSIHQAAAQTGEQLKLGITKQKTAAGGKLTIKFISVAEDSRCPEDVNCVWAGNAKIQIKVAKRGGSAKTFELNTNSEPKSISFEGYEIKLLNLEPKPKANIKTNRSSYTATLVVK